MSTWQLQDAKAKFSEFLDAALRSGPQIVTRRGVETAVLVPMGEWQRLQASARPNLKALLLQTGPRFQGLVPARRSFRRRPTLKLQ